MRPDPTPGAKMQYLIRRRRATSRDELIAHWFANHMPAVIERNRAMRAAGQDGAWHYTATLFSEQFDGPADNGTLAWDGIAQLWYDAPLARPAQASGTVPTDTFHEKVEPYWPWATREWVFVDGTLPLNPPTLNPPFPCTRTGFIKQVSLVAARPGVTFDAMADHWLDIHAPNVRATLEKIGGLRYAVSLSMDEAHAPFAGTAELWFPDRAAQAAFWDAIQPDGFQDFADPARTLRFLGDTEMVGIED